VRQRRLARAMTTTALLRNTDLVFQYLAQATGTPADGEFLRACASPAQRSVRGRGQKQIPMSEPETTTWQADSQGARAGGNGLKAKGWLGRLGLRLLTSWATSLRYNVPEIY